MDYEKIGKYIKSLREKKGYTQDDLAEIVMIGRTAVSKWERGKSLPDYISLIKLSEVFDVSINEILNGESGKNEIVTSNLYKDFFRNRKKIKLLVIIIVLLIFFSLIYYFLTSFKKTKVYTVTGFGNNCKVTNGLLVYTREKSYFNVGKIDCLDKVEKIELYIKNSDKEMLLINSELTNNILFFEINGYDEYLINDYILPQNDVYIKIYFTSGNEFIKLIFNLDYIDKNFIYFNVSSISKNTKNSKVNIEYSEIVKKIIKKLKNENNEYIGEFKYNGGIVKVNFDNTTNNLVITNIDKNGNEEFYHLLNFETLGYIGENFSFSKSKTQFICQFGNCDNYENIVEKFKTIFYNVLLQ